MPELSVILPCYNEAGNIPGLFARYRSLAEKAELEVIFVDNASYDGTGAAIDRELTREENRFARKISLERNDGYGAGIQAGLAAASAPIVAFSHADMQCRPEDCLRALILYRAHAAGGDCIVKGRRKDARPAADRFVTWCYNRTAGVVLGLRSNTGSIPDINAEPKLFSRAHVPALLKGPRDFSFDLFVLYHGKRAGVGLVEFDVEYGDRAWGRSKLAANLGVRLMTAFSAGAKILEMRLGRIRY